MMEPQTTPGIVPIKHQIADSIRAKIMAGESAPGDPLPTVDELSKQWGCAPGVAREAIEILKAEGRVSGTRGKRAVVRIVPQRLRLPVDYSQQQKDLVHRPESERAGRGGIEITSGTPIEQTTFTARYEIVTASNELAEEFGIDSGTSLQRRIYEHVDRDTGRRLAWSVSHIPLTLIEGNLELLDDANEPWPGGHQHQLYTVGIELDRLVRSIDAIQPTPADRQKWGMEPGVPLLHVRSRSIDTDDRIVEVSDAIYPADRIEIAFTEQLKRWPVRLRQAGQQTNS